MKTKPAIDLVALIGREGPEAVLARRRRKAGVMLDRRTRRNRSRADRERKAVAEE